jgi:hypothetical protein
MSELTNFQNELYVGLQALADAEFPKRCNVCGRVYETVDDFIRQTSAVRPDNTGLKQAVNDDDSIVVELYRNCVCGSTLLDYFSDRRDSSTTHGERRAYFETVLVKLMQAGYDRDAARAELIKVMRGEHSELLRADEADTLKKSLR